LEAVERRAQVMEKEANTVIMIGMDGTLVGIIAIADTVKVGFFMSLAYIFFSRKPRILLLH
jgi:cation transport ATPase